MHEPVWRSPIAFSHVQPGRILSTVLQPSTPTMAIKAGKFILISRITPELFLRYLWIAQHQWELQVSA